uniref:Uncharacterized protein n=1 Tax=Knipowitschia caucasica TaxID=637954 RepID=A0AAV2L7U1_KNICA
MGVYAGVRASGRRSGLLVGRTRGADGLGSAIGWVYIGVRSAVSLLGDDRLRSDGGRRSGLDVMLDQYHHSRDRSVGDDYGGCRPWVVCTQNLERRRYRGVLQKTRIKR